MSLDDVFEPGWSAVDLFTDRVPESEAFAAATLIHLANVLEGRAVLERPARDNVLTYYGVGGIGKTELSQRLERWLHGEVPAGTGWPEPPRLDHAVRTARLDFHGSQTVDAIGAVLALRGAVAGPGRPFPAFDLGLTVWWSHARPGQPLPEFRNPARFDVRGQLIDTVGDAVKDAGKDLALGQLTVRAGLAVYDAIRTRRLNDRALRDCPQLERVAEAAARNAGQGVAAALAGLLSWDLERLVAPERSLIVAFADAAEYVQGGDRTQEALLNRIVYLTPGVLWVLTSRGSLDWATPDVPGLPRTGPDRWPGLVLPATGEPRQHLVGRLADEDVTRFLERASGSRGNPELGREAVGRIRDGAHGLPLYLDLSLSIARQSGTDPDHFGGSMPALVTRILADLPEAERDIARTASLLLQFDPALLAAGSGRSEGDAVRFCRRTLVNRQDHPWFPYRLHDVVREALIDESVAEPGAWTAADRRARAGTLLDALRARHDETLDDVERRLAVLEEAARLCAGHDLRADWLRRSLLEMPSMPRTAERMPPLDDRTWIGNLARFFDGYRHDRGRTERVAYFRDLLGEPLPPDIARATRMFLCYGLRDLARADEALTELRAMHRQEPDSSLIRYQICRTLLSARRFDELDMQLRRWPPAEETEARRLRSDLAWERGDLDEAIVGPRLRAGHLRRLGRHRVAQENEIAALWRRAVAGQATPADCDEQAETADRYGMPLRLTTALASKAVLLLGDDHAVTALAADIERLRPATESVGWREWTVAALLALRRDDRATLERVALAAVPTGGSRGAYWVVLDRAFRYAGLPSIFPGDREQPLGEPWRKAIAAIVHP
ncbi:ATP/GTP-binding protein [Actinoplanes lobatus]|uniref:ATP/GTP-binding protein n=1 Tax=Actinoplanes lobatus TaxID=113568 RepID=A0A7W7MHG5_9ACTN|nr:hypothetical protein [Actinoplanes lobatus]MBB4750318.1 hypothetical protein [Actinoplanes lobatus]GGN71352.1 ATP/GTP-binding protein [Actinoplanes lobatus]GIE41888.1 ATP/GTP-binding protein [Actinoplanes lobatus]